MGSALLPGGYFHATALDIAKPQILAGIGHLCGENDRQMGGRLPRQRRVQYGAIEDPQTALHIASVPT